MAIVEYEGGMNCYRNIIVAKIIDSLSLSQKHNSNEYKFLAKMVILCIDFEKFRRNNQSISPPFLILHCSSIESGSRRLQT